MHGESAVTAKLVEALEHHFSRGSVRWCPGADAALRTDLDAVDLVLADTELPDGTALELLEAATDARPDLPVVFLTAEPAMAQAIEAFRRGAYDYILKAGDYLLALPMLVEKNLALWRIKQQNLQLQAQLTQTLRVVRRKNEQLEEAVARLEAMAATDPLTGLANRRAVAVALERGFADAARREQDLACLMIDLDGFKQLNDAIGHQHGDRMLQLVGRVLSANCRVSDVAGRLGGDEFIVLLPQTDAPTARGVADRIRDDFERATWDEFRRIGYLGRLTMSMGLATVRTARPATPEQLLARADHAMYAAKQQGKRSAVTFEARADAPSGLEVEDQEAL